MTTHFNNLFGMLYNHDLLLYSSFCFKYEYKNLNKDLRLKIITSVTSKICINNYYNGLIVHYVSLIMILTKLSLKL